MGQLSALPCQRNNQNNLQDKMKLALTVVCLFGLALGKGKGGKQGLSDADTDMVNKMMDVIDSGLTRDEGEDEKARALFISLTLTSTTTNLATATVTTTETASCAANAAGGLTFTECTDGSAATTAMSLSTRSLMDRARRFPSQRFCLPGPRAKSLMLT